MVICQVAHRVLKRAHALPLGARGLRTFEVLQDGKRCRCLHRVEEPHLFAVVPTDTTDVRKKSRAQRTLVLAGLAYASHDGFTDMTYVLRAY
jgi:hypothetical protein